MKHKYIANVITKMFFFGLSMKFWSGDQQFTASPPGESAGGIPVFQIIDCEDMSLLGHKFAVATFPFYLGRSQDNDIIFQELSVSRAHAKITCHENKIFIQDRGSKYGTLVNGEKLGSQPIPLAGGDEIRLGAKTVFKLTFGDLYETIDSRKNKTTITNDLSSEITMLRLRDLE